MEGEVGEGRVSLMACCQVPANNRRSSVQLLTIISVLLENSRIRYSLKTRKKKQEEAE